MVSYSKLPPPPRTACFPYQLGRLSLFWMMEKFFWKKSDVRAIVVLRVFSPMLRVFFGTGKDLLLFLQKQFCFFGEKTFFKIKNSSYNNLFIE